MLERTIENKVCKWAKDNEFMVIKFTPKGERGWPDRIFISPSGVHIWIEFKAPGKKPRPLQCYRMSCLVSQGVLTDWFDCPNKAIDRLKALV